MAKHECHEALVVVSAAVSAVNTRRFEANLGAVGQLGEQMCAHTKAALAALDRVIETFDPGPDLDPADTLASAPGTPLVDVAFITLLDLRQRAERLERLGRSPDPWLVITECASLRRHLLEAMVQVEQALCEVTGEQVRLTGLRHSKRAMALASRKAYQAYIRAIDAIEARLERGQLTPIGALRLGATNIAMLIGREVYEDLRVDDRRQLRGLQERIFAAVREPSDELRVRRLWMDLCASAGLLERIHQRSELVEHDFELLSAALEELDDDALDVQQLAQLHGRDAALDRLLDAESIDAVELRSCLVALHDKLSRSLGRVSQESSDPQPAEVVALSWA